MCSCSTFLGGSEESVHLQVPRLHPITWAADILCDPQFDKSSRSFIISIMAAIWDSRNRWAHDDAGFDATKSVDTVMETLAMLEKKPARSVGKPRPICTWHGPPVGYVKVNSDGAIHVDEGRAASGVMLRSSSTFVAARSRIYQGLSDSLTVEALALRDACFLAMEKGYTQVICETDCEDLVRLWQTRCSHRALIAPILSEITEISLSFISFEVGFVASDGQ